MGNTFVPFYVHFIWSTYRRFPVFKNQEKHEVEQLLLGISKELNILPMEIFAMPDHVHLLVRLSATHKISDIDLKRRSSKLFNERHPNTLKWQTGYAAFPISYSHVSRVMHYIKNQHLHHKRISFREEYLTWLDSWDVDYQTKYVFDD